jgi:large conductance mechanosensitive channel
VDAARAAGAPIVTYGIFINNVIRFLIVAFAVFMLVRGMNKLVKRHEETAPPPAQEVLLTEIRDLLRAELGEK